MVYFSQLKNSKIYDLNKVKIGEFVDLIFVDGTDYAETTHLIFVDGSKYKKKIPLTYLKEFKEEKDGAKEVINLYLNSPIESIAPFFIKEKENLVGDILDKQVIDVNGVKLVRVNDVM